MPSGGGMEMEMDGEGLGSAFLRVELLRRQLLRPHFIELGLTVGQGQPRILKTLRSKGAMSQRELADLCVLDVTTMSRTLDKLEKLGLVKRTDNPECRRSWVISLTPLGEEKADKVIELFKMADEVFSDGMTAEEVEKLYALMDVIEKNIEKHGEKR